MSNFHVTYTPTSGIFNGEAQYSEIFGDVRRPYATYVTRILNAMLVMEILSAQSHALVQNYRSCNQQYRTHTHSCDEFAILTRDLNRAGVMRRTAQRLTVAMKPAIIIRFLEAHASH